MNPQYRAFISSIQDSNASKSFHFYSMSSSITSAAPAICSGGRCRSSQRADVLHWGCRPPEAAKPQAGDQPGLQWSRDPSCKAAFKSRPTLTWTPRALLLLEDRPCWFMLIYSKNWCILIMWSPRFCSLYLSVVYNHREFFSPASRSKTFCQAWRQLVQKIWPTIPTNGWRSVRPEKVAWTKTKQKRRCAKMATNGYKRKKMFNSMTWSWYDSCVSGYDLVDKWPFYNGVAVAATCRSSMLACTFKMRSFRPPPIFPKTFTFHGRWSFQPGCTWKKTSNQHDS